MDRGLFDFAGLAPTGVPDADGDVAFDVDPSFEAPRPTAAAIDAAAIPVRRRAAADTGRAAADTGRDTAGPPRGGAAAPASVLPGGGAR
jgi:hypothetical protein